MPAHREPATVRWQHGVGNLLSDAPRLCHDAAQAARRHAGLYGALAGSRRRSGCWLRGAQSREKGQCVVLPRSIETDSLLSRSGVNFASLKSVQSLHQHAEKRVGEGVAKSMLPGLRHPDVRQTASASTLVRFKLAGPATKKPCCQSARTTVAHARRLHIILVGFDTSHIRSMCPCGSLANMAGKYCRGCIAVCETILRMQCRNKCSSSHAWEGQSLELRKAVYRGHTKRTAGTHGHQMV